jgi:hypothetical protein
MNPSLKALLGFGGPGAGVPPGRAARGRNAVLVSDPVSSVTGQSFAVGCRTVMRSR